ncbi:DUF6093 family protein [Bifidobacterium sp. ESL0819]|uniref:DUF6093 family protein n=1 Tax=Bifidobacterium sp. ESL0819 TaxID=3448589 RepID=UPI0040422938
MTRRRFRQPDMAKLRAYAESRMTDTIRISRPGKPAVDPVTGAETPTGEVMYEGPGKVQTSGGMASQVSTASGDSSNIGGLVPEWSLYLHLPISATGLREKDVALVVDSKDPDLKGRCMRLVNMQSEKTLATARRWNVQEIPEED